MVLLMEFAPKVPAWVLRPLDLEVVHPKDLAPLMGVKGRDLMFRARVLRTVLALRTMPGTLVVKPQRTSSAVEEKQKVGERKTEQYYAFRSVSGDSESFFLSFDLRIDRLAQTPS